MNTGDMKMECEETMSSSMYDADFVATSEDGADVMDEGGSYGMEDEECQVARGSTSAAVTATVTALIQQGTHHDYQDVIEFGVEGVLNTYGLGAGLTNAERDQLRVALLKLGGIFQTREVIRLLHEETNPILDQIRPHTWSLRMEGVLRKALLAELREEQAERRSRGAPPVLLSPASSADALCIHSVPPFRQLPSGWGVTRR
jgi:hypothetical protein